MLSRSVAAVLGLALALTVAGCGAAAQSPDAGKDAKPEAKPDGSAQTETAADAPAETAADVPAESPADVPGENPADVPAESPADVPAESPTDAGAEVDPACLTIPQDATRKVHLRITADNECDVFVNGTDVGSTTSWPSPVTLDVSLFIYPGRINVIAVMGRNTSSQGGNDRGIIGELDDLTDGGSKVVIVTDKTWRSSKVEKSGWPATLYDDSGWDQATEIANHGDPPWSALLGTSNAKWLWTAPVPASTTDKPDAETGFFRKAFYFGTDGTTVIDKPACPPVGP